MRTGIHCGLMCLLATAGGLVGVVQPDPADAARAGPSDKALTNSVGMQF